MIGETLSHYVIGGKIGAGAMGEVYRAHDPRLGREVAIKVVHTSLSQSPKRIARFEQEARAAGALNHPNVLAIYDVGHDRGVPFLVTELLDGETLRRRIESGSLTQRKVLEYAAQIADGLAAAHSHNIIHRDLKPDNIFITRDGRLKILDFGLAKLIERDPENPVSTESPTAALTDEGAIVGTPGYMSPEQLLGQPADARTDIFAFGIILYEMICGRRPFAGKSAAEISAAIIRDDPPPLSCADRAVSPTLDRVIRQCLEKDPNDRFESARDLAHMLRAVSDTGEIRVAEQQPEPRHRGRWLPALAAATIAVAAVLIGMELVERLHAPALPEVRHIAVLPFEAISGDPDDRSVAAGLAETIFDALEIMEADTHGAVWVVPPTSVSSLEDARTSYNATIALRGVLESDTDSMRLELELVDPATGRVFDARALEGDPHNLTLLQGDPARLAWEMLGFTPSREAEQQLDSLATNTLPACRGYVVGRGRLALAESRGDYETAVGDLQQAVDEDPAFVTARIALARASVVLYELTADTAWSERAIAEAKRAVALNDDSAEAHLVLGDALGAAGEPEKQLEAYREAARRARTAEAHLALGEAAQNAGRYEEAEAALQTTINMRPDDSTGHSLLAWLYYRMGRNEAATNQFRHAARCAPENEQIQHNLGAMLYLLGRRDDAMAAFEKAISIRPNPTAYSNLGTLYFEAGHFGDAAGAFEHAVELCDEASRSERYYLVANLASARYWGGERELAETDFERAISLVERHLAEHGPDLDALVGLASYLGMLGRTERGLQVIERAIELEPTLAGELGAVAEAYADLGEDEQALQWMARAVEGGLELEWIESRPSFNRLRSEPGYREIVHQSGVPG